VTWKKVPRAAGYDVFRRNPDGSCLQLTPQGTTLTSVQDPIPAILGVYHYQVGVRTGAGMNSTELSQWTAYDVAAAGGAPATGSAAAPTGLTATGTPTTATLTWVAPKGAINYRVNRAVAGTTVWNSLTPTPITATTLGNDVFPDPTLAYTYAVLAYQRNGQFGEARVDFRAPPPTNPTGLTGTASGSTVTIAWQPVRYAAGYLGKRPSGSQNLLRQKGPLPRPSRSPPAAKEHAGATRPAGSPGRSLAARLLSAMGQAGIRPLAEPAAARRVCRRSHPARPSRGPTVPCR
jgi:hypothetical protein